MSIANASEKAATEGEARYRDLALASDQPVIIVVQGHIRFVNDAAVGMLGATHADQLLSGPIADFVDLETLAPGNPAVAPLNHVEVEVRRLDRTRATLCAVMMACRYEGQDALQLLFRDVAARRKLEREVQFLTRHDALTDLPNRTDFRDRLAGAMARAQRTARQVAVVGLNLDRFRQLNAQHGSEVGDRVLQIVASRLKDSIRKSDSAARVSGSEFALILEGIDQREQASVVANRLMEQMKEPFDVGHVTIDVSASAGIAAFPADAKDIDSLIRSVDVAMFAAKDAGGAAFRFYFPSMESETQRDQSRRAQILMRIESLTAREREVMNVLVDGNSNKVIAYLLGASPRTIENHRAKVMGKMHADSLPDLVRMVLESRQPT